MSRLLIVGLGVTIMVLGFNYYTEIMRNAETARELRRVKLELQQGSSGRSEARKKLELCHIDLAASRDVCKKRDGTMKKKDQMVTDLTMQINESRKRENKFKEEIEAERAKLLELERKCDVKTSAKKRLARPRKNATHQL